jgi:hypothetical protein
MLPARIAQLLAFLLDTELGPGPSFGLFRFFAFPPVLTSPEPLLGWATVSAYRSAV